MSRSQENVNNINEPTIEQNLLYMIFSNLVNELHDFLKEKTPFCQYTWITAQYLIDISSSRSYHKSYLSLLHYFSQNSEQVKDHSLSCSCMKIDFNCFNRFGLTPFLKSLPCSYDLLRLQVKMGADLSLKPRCSLLIVINPFYSYMKYLINLVYHHVADEVSLELCLEYLCTMGQNPNYVPESVSTNLMILFSLAADVSIQSEFENIKMKQMFLCKLNRILDLLLSAGLDPTLRFHSNKLSYELHGDGLFDFIFMLKFPIDEISLEFICSWIIKLIQHGCDPDTEMRSNCRELLKYKLNSEKPNALSVFLYVLHELFEGDFAHSPSIQRIFDVLYCLTSQNMVNRTISYFRKMYPSSIYSHFFFFQPSSLKSIARFVVAHSVLGNRLLNIENFNIPSNLIQYVVQLMP